MCIVVIKNKDVAFPSDEILENCFENNDDGAGFMYPNGEGQVIISKGLMTFKDFIKELKLVRSVFGDAIPYVMHFRISTQGGVVPELTHPFPLSNNMDNLRLLNVVTDIGIVHNGIISLTSEYGGAGVLKHSDTMKFITDYLTLLIDDKNYHKNAKIITLITKLCKSKIAIMDGDGTITKIGEGWVEKDNIIYSNSSYLKVVTYAENYSEYYKNIYKNCGYEGDYDYDNYTPVKGRKAIGYSRNFQPKTLEELNHPNNNEPVGAEKIQTDDELNAKQTSFIDEFDYAERYYNARTGLYDFPPGKCAYKKFGTKYSCEFCSNTSCLTYSGADEVIISKK